MVRLRNETLVKLPPPIYHPDSTSVTLAIYHGGTLEDNLYVGGKIRKLDYVDVEKLNFLCIDEYIQDLFVEGSLKKIHTPLNQGFKLLTTEEELKIYGRKYLKKNREFPLIVEAITDVVVQPAIYENAASFPVDIHEEIDAIEKDIILQDQNTETVPQKGEKKGDKTVSDCNQRESSAEFFARVDDTQEWIDEYCRRYPGPAKDVQVVDDSSDASYIQSDSIHLDDDETDVEFVEEPAYTIQREENDSDSSVVWLHFDPLPECSSSDDELWNEPEKTVGQCKIKQ